MFIVVSSTEAPGASVLVAPECCAAGCKPGPRDEL